MSDHFVKASFTLTVTKAEAAVFRRIDRAIDILQGNELEPHEERSGYEALGDDFARCFPQMDTPFASFRSIFTDPDYPRLGFTIAVGPSDDSGNCSLWIHGDQVDVEVAATLIQAVAVSALPFGFEYALDCDRMRVGEFGGGYVAIHADDIEFGTSARGIERALGRYSGDGANGLVLAIRNDDDGLLIWNNKTGFGSVGTATIFATAEAANFHPLIGINHAEWLCAPTPLK